MKTPFLRTLKFVTAGAVLAQSVSTYAGIKTEVKEVKEKVREEFIQSEIKINLAIKAEVESLGLKLDYDYEIEPVYKDQLFERRDVYGLKFDGVTNNKLKETTNLLLGLDTGIESKGEVVFSRHFDSHEKARKASRYHFLEKFPVNSDILLKQFNPGDYIGFTLRSSLLLGANLSKVTTSQYVPMIGSGVAATGEYQVHILKLDEKKYRLKIIGVREHAKSSYFKIDYTKVLTPFGSTYVNRRVTKLLDLDPIDFTTDKGNAFIDMIDLTFDLTNPSVADAYNKMMSQVTEYNETTKEGSFDYKRMLDKFKDGTINLVPISKNLEKTSKQFTLDLTQLDSLLSNKTLVDSGIINRTFKGNNNQKFDRSRFKLGNRMLKFINKTYYTVNEIESIDENNNSTYYVLYSNGRNYSGNGFFGYFHEETNATMNALFRADKEYKNLDLVNIGVKVTRKDRTMRSSELEKFLRRINWTFPESITTQLDFTKIKDDDRQNAYSEYEIVFDPKILQANNLTQITGANNDKVSAIINDLSEYILKNQKFRHLPKYQFTPHVTVNPSDKLTNPLDYFSEDIRYVAQGLAGVLNQNATDKQKVESLMTLRQSRLFSQLGVGYIVSHIPQSEIDSTTYIKVLVEGEKDTVRYESSNVKVSDEYRYIIYFASVLNDEGYDLRKEQEFMNLKNHGLEKK